MGAIGGAPSVVFFPLAPVFASLLFGAWWIAAGIYIYSSGEIKQQTCTLEADKAPMKYCANQTAVPNANCHCGYESVMDESLQYTLLYHLFGLLWTTQFFQAMTMPTLASVFATYYFRGGSYGTSLSGWLNTPVIQGFSQDVVVPHRVRGVWLVTRRHPPVYSHHRRVHGAPAQEGWQGQRPGQVRRVLRPVLPVVPAEDHRVDQSEHVHPHRHRGQVVLRVRDGGAVVDLQQPGNRGSRQRHRRRPALPRQALRVPHVRSSRVLIPRRRRLHDRREQSLLPAAHRRLLHHPRVSHRGSVHVRRGDGDRHHAPVVLQGLQAARRQATVRAAAAGIRAREVRDQG